MSKPTGNQKPTKIKFVKTDELRPKGSQTNCLRPLGLCDLGGCCETCWYSTGYKKDQNTSPDNK